MKHLLLLSLLTALSEVILPVSGWGGGNDCQQTPFQLIEIDEGNHVNLLSDALRFLRDPQNEGREVIPIVVMGPARSGKSFFLRTTTDCEDVFAVGHEHSSKTKGAIALPMVPVDAGKKKGPLFLLIDTEGLAIEKSRDQKILFFSVLAASHIVYHVDSKIIGPDVERLDEVTRLYDLYENMGIGERIEKADVTWVVERNTLEEIDDLEKLKDDVLRTGDGNSLRTKTVNRIWEVEFRGQDPFYIRPARKNTTEWLTLTTFTKDELDKDYLEKMQEVKNVLMKAKSKKLTKENGPFTCREYADYLERIIGTVKTANDDVLEIPGLMTFVVVRAVAAAEHVYQGCMSKVSLPMDDGGWNISDMDCRKKAINKYSANSVTKDVGTYNQTGHNLLNDMFKKESKTFREKNIQETKTRCEDRLTSLKNELSAIWPTRHSSEDFTNQAMNIAEQHRKFIGTSAEKHQCEKEWEKIRHEAVQDNPPKRPFWEREGEDPLGGGDSTIAILATVSLATIIAIIGIVWRKCRTNTVVLGPER